MDQSNNESLKKNSGVACILDAIMYSWNLRITRMYHILKIIMQGIHFTFMQGIHSILPHKRSLALLPRYV